MVCLFMKHLFTFYDTIFNGFTSEFLDILTLFALLSAVTVIINKNPIGALLSLIGLFSFVAIYLIFCGLTFIGFSYLIVYIGAVSILFLFILMLIDIRASELQNNHKNTIPLAIVITILLSYVIYQVLPYYMVYVNHYSKNKELIELLSLNRNSTLELVHEKVDIENISNIMYISSNNWDGNIAETSHITTVGNILYTSYNVWLFIASLILLLAMVGAIIITIKKD